MKGWQQELLKNGWMRSMANEIIKKIIKRMLIYLVIISIVLLIGGCFK